MILPNFLVIGSAKAGTSTLAKYLASHPEVCFAKSEEPNFFAIDKEFEKGLQYYSAEFEHYKGEKLIGEKSWRYSCSDVYPEAFSRLMTALPKLKLIYLLRDPLPRAISMWRELRDEGRYVVARSVAEALRSDPNINSTTRYFSIYQRFAEHYGTENLKIFFFEDLARDPAEFFREITQFLEIETVEPDAGLHANPSIGQRSDGRLLEWLRTLGLADFLRANSPTPLRELARTYLKQPIGEIEISVEDKRAFLLKHDAEIEGILSASGRSRDFWTTPSELI